MRDIQKFCLQAYANNFILGFIDTDNFSLIVVCSYKLFIFYKYLMTVILKQGLNNHSKDSYAGNETYTRVAFSFSRPITDSSLSVLSGRQGSGGKSL